MSLKPPRKRIARNGTPTNALVFSAALEGNDRVFPRILQLYVARGSIVGRRDLWQGRLLAADT